MKCVKCEKKNEVLNHLCSVCFREIYGLSVKDAKMQGDFALTSKESKLVVAGRGLRRFR